VTEFAAPVADRAPAEAAAEPAEPEIQRPAPDRPLASAGESLRHPTALPSRAELARALGRTRGNAAASTELEREADSVAERAGFVADAPPSPGHSGVPIPPAPRERLEQTLGRDLGEVRLHTDSTAGAAARAVGAQAFTAGRDVFFAPGRYAPDTPEGQRLLAHEVAHTAQQQDGAPAPQLQAEPQAPRAKDTSQVIASVITLADSRAIVAIAESATPDDTRILEDTTPTERAGMVKVLTDLNWTTVQEELATVALIRYRGRHVEVLRHLESLGYRQRLLDSVDNNILHAQLEAMLAEADRARPAADPSVGDPAITAVVQNPEAKPKDVMALGDFSRATHSDRLRLLQILLAMWHSDKDEEAKILVILGSAPDLAALMQDVKALGLKQRLFDHIDDEDNVRRLVALLTPLHDPELAADLVVFQQGAGEGGKSAFSHAAVKAWESFKFENVLQGLIRPLWHPLDSLAAIGEQEEMIIKEPSAYRVVTLLRDIYGFAATWLFAIWAVLTVVALGIAVLLWETGVGIIVSLILAVLAQLALAAAGVCGTLFIALAVIRGILDLVEAGAATTAQERERQEDRIAEDLQVVGLAAALKGLQLMAKGLLGLRSAPDKVTDPDALNKIANTNQAAQADFKSQGDAASARANSAGAKVGVAPTEQAPAPAQGGGGAPPPPPPPSVAAVPPAPRPMPGGQVGTGAPSLVAIDPPRPAGPPIGDPPAARIGPIGDRPLPPGTRIDAPPAPGGGQQQLPGLGGGPYRLPGQTLPDSATGPARPVLPPRPTTDISIGPRSTPPPPPPPPATAPTAPVGEGGTAIGPQRPAPTPIKPDIQIPPEWQPQPPAAPEPVPPPEPEVAPEPPEPEATPPLKPKPKPKAKVKPPVAITPEPPTKGGVETTEVAPEVARQLELRKIRYAREVTFVIDDQNGNPVLAGRFDFVFRNPVTGELVVVETKGIDLESLTTGQRIYVPMLEGMTGVRIRITSHRGGSVDLAYGDTPPISGDVFVRVGRGNLKEFVDALEWTTTGKRIKYSFRDRGGTLHYFSSEEEWRAFLESKGLTPVKPGGKKR
jgi:uncharacterized protein DUF4157